MRKLSQEEVIERFKKKYGDKYDYSLVEYKNRRTPIKIICKKHNLIFEALPERFAYGKWICPKCGKENYRSKRAKTTEQFIKEAKAIHGDKYDYSLVEYINIDTPIEIICKEHGSFFQAPYEHLKGKGINGGSNCPKCFGLNKTTEQFIKEAKAIHGDKYDYSLVEYKSALEPVKIICKKHGIFEQPPNRHISTNMCGCPNCCSSKGEEKINLFLKEKNIYFESQKRFEECKNKRSLPFDFYIPSKKLLIEYDGIQHFEPISFGGDASKNFVQTKKNDLIKEEFCKKNNLKLLRIPYWDYSNIDSILKGAII